MNYNNVSFLINRIAISFRSNISFESDDYLKVLNENCQDKCNFSIKYFCLLYVKKSVNVCIALAEDFICLYMPV